MDRVYQYGAVMVFVKAPDNGKAYRVVLESEGASSTPLSIDAHWGADHAAKLALETYLKALTEPERFVAQERLEASQGSFEERRSVEAWALQVVKEAAAFGNVLEDAAEAADQERPEDISTAVDTYFELLEFGWQAELESLLGSGYSKEEANAELYRRNLERSEKRWLYVPRMRPPSGVVI